MKRVAGISACGVAVITAVLALCCVKFTYSLILVSQLVVLSNNRQLNTSGRPLLRAYTANIGSKYITSLKKQTKKKQHMCIDRSSVDIQTVNDQAKKVN